MFGVTLHHCFSQRRDNISDEIMLSWYIVAVVLMLPMYIRVNVLTAFHVCQCILSVGRDCINSA